MVCLKGMRRYSDFDPSSLTSMMSMKAGLGVIVIGPPEYAMSLFLFAFTFSMDMLTTGILHHFPLHLKVFLFLLFSPARNAMVNATVPKSNP